jgi:phage baseplate assembly protein W
VTVDEPAFLGRGWAFPPSFAGSGAEVAMSSGSRDIAESVRILLSTLPGERVMRPGFGAGLELSLFAEVDQRLLNAIAARVSDAVLTDEPRIRLDDADATGVAGEPGVVRVSLTYTVLATNSRYNLVYPFSLVEASGVAGAIR